MTHETISTLQTLTLSELREILNERGISIGMSTLSEFISDGDIAEQLAARRKGNRLLFPPSAADALAAFIPLFRENPNFKNAARPEALRRFLSKTDEPSADSLVPGTCTLSEFRETANLGAQIVAAMQQAGLIAPPEDTLINAQAAAALLCCHRRNVSLYVRPARRGRWRRADILRYIQSL